jgi:hypothetical protein
MALLRCGSAIGKTGGAAMIDLDIGQINVRDGSDEIALQYLGAAAVLTWARVPADVRELLLRRAMSLTGLPATEDLEAKIISLLRSHAKPAGTTAAR